MAHKHQKIIDRYMRHENADAIARFCALVDKGYTPFVAAIHATGQMPGIVGTDTQYLAAFGTNGSQFSGKEEMGDLTRKHRPGYSPGAVYHSGVKRWVSSKADVIRAAKEMNVTITEADGTVWHREHAVDPTENNTPLAADSVRYHERQLLKQEPGLADTKAKRKKLRQTVLEKHTPANRKHLIKE